MTSTTISLHQAVVRPTATLVSVTICTRDRGDSITATIKSLLKSDYPNFEIVVIDQSAGNETERALAPWADDQRVHYVHSASHGVGLSHNISLHESRGELVLVTDDDCEVPPDWISRMVLTMERYPQAAVVFCDVVPAPYDQTKGHIPVIFHDREMLLSTLDDWRESGGGGAMGAGMAVRRSVVMAMGGFDSQMGAGSRFRSGWETDIAMRALLKGHKVLRTPAAQVVHFGFRPHKDAAPLMRRYMYGAGALHAKLFKCGSWKALLLFGFEFWRAVIVPFFSAIARLQRPKGLGRAIYLLRGFADAWQVSVDREHFLFKRPAPSQGNAGPLSR